MLRMMEVDAAGGHPAAGLVEQLLTVAQSDGEITPEDLAEIWHELGAAPEALNEVLDALEEAGVDVDLLVRGASQDIRKRVRQILERCLPGRFALGSGNTIANYIPLRSYLTMLDEVRHWNAEQGRA